MTFALEHKLAIVTGANGGIGYAIAESLLNEQAAVIFPVHRQSGNIQKLADKYGEERVCVLNLDIRSLESIDRFVETVGGKFGRVDILVNNAGISRPSPLEQLNAETWDDVMDTNLKGPFFLTQKVLPLLKKSGSGSIVNITSMSGHEPHTGMGAYSTSKTGLIMLTRQMALEWAPYNIRVNAVSPGLIRTPLSEEIYRNEEMRKKREELTPLKRIGTGQDIAEIVLFLCSPRSSFITGQTILADGGLLATTLNHVPGRPGRRN
jgi:NAD(P)-dependent dehydrogenase (short-subunit alcohol dehydrogenase family)